MSADRTFLDTNIIIYAYDVSAGSKHDTAKQIVQDLWNSGTGLISTQVLQELYVSITRKIPVPLDIKSARGLISDFLKWDIVINDGTMILSAIDIQARHKYSFWDSLIIASAIKANADILLSEDLTDGQTISGLKIHNPFAR
jgi:predicted nucleic acid-binding protein